MNLAQRISFFRLIASLAFAIFVVLLPFHVSFAFTAAQWQSFSQNQSGSPTVNVYAPQQYQAQYQYQQPAYYYQPQPVYQYQQPVYYPPTYYYQPATTYYQDYSWYSNSYGSSYYNDSYDYYGQDYWY